MKNYKFVKLMKYNNNLSIRKLKIRDLFGKVMDIPDNAIHCWAVPSDLLEEFINTYEDVEPVIIETDGTPIAVWFDDADEYVTGKSDIIPTGFQFSPEKHCIAGEERIMGGGMFDFFEVTGVYTYFHSDYQVVIFPEIPDGFRFQYRITSITNDVIEKLRNLGFLMNYDIGKISVGESHVLAKSEEAIEKENENEGSYIGCITRVSESTYSLVIETFDEDGELIKVFDNLDEFVEWVSDANASILGYSQYMVE